jgi:hypothetical protein
LVVAREAILLFINHQIPLSNFFDKYKNYTELFSGISDKFEEK